MTPTAALHDGRNAFRARAWAEACARLTEAQTSPQFELIDLERLATAAYLSGSDERSEATWVRAHQAYSGVNDVPRSVRCVFWLVMQLLAAREPARASGWLATAQRELAGCEHECPEEGLLLVVDVRRRLSAGDVAAAVKASDRAAALADRFPDADLKAFTLLTQGFIGARQTRLAEAAACFDELMVAVSVEDVSPIAVGVVYCAVIDACYDVADIARAREWTATLSRWCEAQPQLAAFRGQCAVHRAETMRFGGAWSEAVSQATQVCRGAPADSSGSGSWRGMPIGAACYELAEIHRMRGEFAKAEEAYRDASRHGRTPEPGFALLRLSQGRHNDATASIRRALELPLPRFARASVLAAGVEIGVATGDLDAARRSSGELEELARTLPAPYLRALSAQVIGAVLLAQGNASKAVSRLRDAWMDWQSLDVPYEAARVRVLMGLACRALGDSDGLSMEFDAARRVFARLGAAPDVARVDEILGTPSGPSLTPREIQVVKLVAAGRTNRAIARSLGISERTVDRHVSNILTKLDLSSRAAATAYAYEHGLL